MGKVFDAIKARFQTRDIPKTERGRFNALMRSEKGNTKKVAERLGVSQRQVQRIAKGDRKIENSKPETLKRLEQEVSKGHQPRVRAQAEKRARERGLTVETRAQFGFSADAGSTDDPRWRRLTEDVPDHLIPGLFEALRANDEAEVERLIGQGLAEEYFRMPGTDTERLDVEFGDVDYIELDYR
ncbi:telomere-protecting terminal protein Tpg [Streptomyces sp. H27-H5]|uniref:telomere-protecting terminal protein Tpg n=1 Tax=Streptomyces sp. H27-H5 TaxID=2996460 RepID=UPI00226F41AF|nr:helix-turn-helix transcriptional regulator [Streptomyces sp. H27-H5]MCY0961461.1 helix-turn-helix transcriptional regulator [Streptomyces sp. H27-H5]